MKKTIFACFITLLLNACAVNVASVWEKRGATPEQEKKDRAECMFEANKYSQEGLLIDNEKRINNNCNFDYWY